MNRSTLAFTALALAGCGGQAGEALTTGSTSGGGGASASASTSNVSTSNASSTASAVAVATTSAGSGAGGGGMVATCDPAPDPNSFWGQSAVRYGDIDPMDMCKYRGDVVLVVNTAEL